MMVHFVMLHGIAWYYIYIVLSRIVSYYILQVITINICRYKQKLATWYIFCCLFVASGTVGGWVGGCKAQKAAITISVWGADSAAELWHLSKPQPSPADSQPECHSMASHLPLILNEFYLRCEHQSEIYEWVAEDNLHSIIHYAH